MIGKREKKERGAIPGGLTEAKLSLQVTLRNTRRGRWGNGGQGGKRQKRNLSRREIGGGLEGS